MSDKQKDLIREVFMRHGFTIKDGREDLADYVYAAAYELLQAAPAVQMEVVGWQFYQDGKWWNGDDRIEDHRKNTVAAGIPVRDVYTAPQPVEQHALNRLLVEALERIAAWPDGGNRYGQAKIKIFAAEALAAYYKRGEEK